MRTLLMLIVAACVGIAYVANFAHGYSREQAAIEDIFAGVKSQSKSNFAITKNSDANGRCELRLADQTSFL